MSCEPGTVLTESTLAAGVLLQAVGLGVGHNACEAGILTSITLYSLSKLFVYLFLGELDKMCV